MLGGKADILVPLKESHVHSYLTHLDVGFSPPPPPHIKDILQINLAVGIF